MVLSKSWGPGATFIKYSAPGPSCLNEKLEQHHWWVYIDLIYDSMAWIWSMYTECKLVYIFFLPTEPESFIYIEHMVHWDDLVMDYHNPAVKLQGCDNMYTMSTVFYQKLPYPPWSKCPGNVSWHFSWSNHGQNGFTVQSNNFLCIPNHL